MKVLNITIIILSILLLSACSKVRESAGVTRKSMDEFKVIENPPLIIPPEFNLLPPNQLSEKDINDVESNLAKEILFGLNNENSNNNKKISTINNILSNAGALELKNSVREEIDQQFSNEIKTNSIYGINWEDEVDVLDALKESERIRNNNFEGESIITGETPTKIKIIKKKKKKRFILF